jgi:hypothetical protein
MVPINKPGASWVAGDYVQTPHPMQVLPSRFLHLFAAYFRLLSTYNFGNSVMA